MYESYLALGGVEIANVDRLVGYAKSVGCSVSWLKANGCGTLRYALGDELPYTHETIDQAPWYDQSQPDLSSRFLGIMVIDQKGLSDSSRQASLTEGIVDGGTIGGQRRASREARFRVLAVAEGSDALDYGIAWLSSALDADKCGQHGGRCGVADLEFFTTCPEEVSEVYAGDALVPDTPEHVIEDLREQSTDLEPIVNYAPEIKGDETWRVRARNLFTNPNLVGDGTWAEVRRNFCKTPIPKVSGEGQWGFAITGGSSSTSIVSDSRFEGESAAAMEILSTGSGGFTRAMAGLQTSVGDVWQISMKVVPPPGASVAGLRMSFGGTAPPDNTRTDFEVIDNGDGSFTVWSELEVTGVGSGSGLADPILSGFPTREEGQVWLFGDSIYEKSSKQGPYFDGSTPDFSVDPDMRTRWLGEPNASESVMEIERVAGLIGANAIGGVSTWEGKPAVRIIPTMDSIVSYVEIVPHPVPPGPATLMGTLHLERPLTGTIGSGSALRLQRATPLASTSGSPNEAGSYMHRLVSPSGGSRMLLRHGGTQGSGYVWWTDIGIFEGDYGGSDAFSGDTESERPEWRYSWEGEPNSSVSVWEEKGTWAPVYENLFPNPRLKGNGTWAEVRRNVWPYPRATAGIAAVDSNYSRTSRDYIPGGGVRGERLAEGGNAGLEFTFPVEEGSTYFVSYEFAGLNDPLVPVGYDPSWSAQAPTSWGFENGRVWAFFEPTFSGTFRLRVRLSGAVGDWIELDRILVEKVSVPGPYFDGSSPDFSVDPDMRQRWLGTPNASESVMEIEEVSGVGGLNAIAGVSTRNGKPAMRIIPTGDGLSMAYAVISTTASSVTGIGTVSLDAPLQGTLSDVALMLEVGGVGVSAPNLAGDHPLRVMDGETAGGYSAISLTNGATLGNGDVWWTDVGIYAGNYPYEAFNGDSDPADTGIEQPEDFRIRWTGQPDASTSVMEGETVAYFGKTPIGGVEFIVSTLQGRPAGRTIRLPYATATPQVVTPFRPYRDDGYTGGVKVYRTVPGSLAANIVVQNSSSPWGSSTIFSDGNMPEPGETATNFAHFVSSAEVGSRMRLSTLAEVGQSLWFQDPVLIAGEYSGPIFNADTGWFQVDGNWYYTTQDNDGLITAYPGRAIFTYPTDDIKRFMHDVATVSGPLLIEELPTASSPFKGAILEFTIASERGYIYTPPRELSLAAAELSAAADQDINLIKNPAFETALPLLQPVGYNLATNPSVETDATNWSASGGAGSRSTLASAYGDYSYLNQGTGSGATINLATIYSQAASIPGDGSLAGRVRKLTLGMWAAASISSGSAQPGTIGFHANINGVWHVLEVLSDTSQFGGYYFMHEVDLPSDWDGNISLRLQAAFPNSGTSTVRLFADGAFIGLGGV